MDQKKKSSMHAKFLLKEIKKKLILIMKNIIFVLSILTLFGCGETIKKTKEKSQESAKESSILVVNYELNEMTLEDHAKLGSDVVGNFAPGKIDGLIGKTFIGNVDKGVFGGVYYFTSSSSLDAYLDSELWKGIVAHPNLVNFKTDTYGIAPVSYTHLTLPTKREE